MQLRAVTRGRYQQIEDSATGKAPQARLFGCQVLKPPREVSGKTYVTLDLEDAVGDLQVLDAVDGFVRSQATAAYSPWGRGDRRLVAKVVAATAFEDAEGDPAAPWALLQNSTVDVVVRPGAFGDFGYCWLVARVKPGGAAG
jgi:hypothetical protein